MCTGWHACAVHINYLSIVYLVSSCDVSPPFQEQGADVFMAPIDCKVQRRTATLQ